MVKGQILIIDTISYMIYNEKYKVKFYQDSRTKKEPVLDYLESLNLKTRQKINKYINYLRDKKGYMDEPYCRHIQGKIRELRVDFSRNRYRIFYFTFINRNIILLHAYQKKTKKSPIKEINIAINNYKDAVNNFKLYED